jgi:parallel beta-helix repeat protein
VHIRHISSRLALLLALPLLLVPALVACDDDAEESNTPLTIEEKKALRVELLAASDDFTFESPPATSSRDCDIQLEAAGTADADALILAIDGASSYAVICLKPGSYAMDKSIVISDASNITIKGIGDGPEDTILDFAGHTGDKGFDVTTPGFWIENLYIKNTTGNGVEVKAQGTADNPSVFRKLKVDWDIDAAAVLDCGDDDPRRDHGAYSVYPTRSSYAIVEFSEVEGASDAGLYIGQVEHGIVRHNFVHGNVAGLEVENSFDVEVRNNTVTGNSGGILALQEPGLTRLANDTVLIRDNVVDANNGCNFAKPNTTVSNIPAGTGMMSFSGVNIEFRDNTVTNNNATGLLIVSNVLLSLIAGEAPSYPTGYDPYAHEIYVNGNTFTGNGSMPIGIAAVLANVAGGFDAVVWDGFYASTTADAAAAKVCLGETALPTFVDLSNNLCQEPEDEGAFIACVATNSTNDVTAHTCTGSVTVTSF